MPKVKVTVLKVMDQKEIFTESPVEQSKPLDPCSIHHEGQEFIVEPDMNMPEGFCHWAWSTVKNSAKILMFGGNYPWQEEPGVTVTCCTDGLRPVIYKVERIED